MTGRVYFCRWRLPKNRLLRFRPGLGVKQIASRNSGKHSKGVIVRPARTSGIRQENPVSVLEDFRAFIHVNVRWISGHYIGIDITNFFAGVLWSRDASTRSFDSQGIAYLGDIYP